MISTYRTHPPERAETPENEAEPQIETTTSPLLKANNILEAYGLHEIDESELETYRDLHLTWTDGSTDGKSTKGSVFLRKHSPHNTVIEIPNQPISLVAEIHAIELALYMVPPHCPLTIFTDSQSAIDSIFNYHKWSYKQKKNSPVSSNLQRIAQRLQARSEKHTVTSFDHIYSHITQKKRKARRAGQAALKKHYQKINKYKKHYGPLWNKVVYGNHKVDRLFEKKPAITPKARMYSNQPLYSIYTENANFLDGNPTKYVKNKLREELQKEWYKNAAKKRTAIDRNAHVNPNLGWLQSPKIHETAYLTDWWHKVEQRLISSVSKYHRT